MNSEDLDRLERLLSYYNDNPSAGNRAALMKALLANADELLAASRQHASEDSG